MQRRHSYHESAKSYDGNSLRPGIGAGWFARYWRDVYLARDGVVREGKTIRPPRYYDILLDKLGNGVSIDKEYDRYIGSLEHVEDNTA